MSNVITLPVRAVTLRACPAIGYIISQLQADMLRFNLQCPRCSKHRVGDFQPFKFEENTKT